MLITLIEILLTLLEMAKVYEVFVDKFFSILTELVAMDEALIDRLVEI